ncbi:MAG: efflux RND transporter periplasmic adaptor subunit [Bacteroidales bacterium]|jgi:HlyD family secretion protein|nr:efflux RND transporter periplasmic adaptor subunit [Bacteroidales bacterium]
MKNKKLLRLILIVLVLLVAFLILGSKLGWIGSPEGSRVSVEEVSRRSIVEIVTASGKVQPVTEVKISPDVSGEIIELPIREGDFVKRGDLLAKINPDLYVSTLDRVAASVSTSRANLANARARSSQAEAQFINATSSFNRNKQLFDQHAISESEFDAARAQYLVAQAEVEAARQSVIGAEFQVRSAEASLKEARESLAKTSIFAPMDGTISRLDAEIGERVVGTSQFAGTEILRIANLNQMEVLVEVNENDIIRVNEGDTASIEIDAFLGTNFLGVVTAISNSAKTEGLTVDQVTNFEVKIQILAESYQHLVPEEQQHLSPFRPGMSATVDIQTQRVSDVLSVPIQSVTTRQPEPPKGDSLQAPAEKAAGPIEYVFLFRDGKAVLQAVTTGIQDSQFIEIKEGLEEGQEVISGPYRSISRELKDGDAVIKTRREELFVGN